jgi:hypothetical protein
MDQAQKPLKNSKQRQEFLSELLNEWKLFWHTLAGEEPAAKESFETEHVRSMNQDQISQLTKELSRSRQKLNRELEEINADLDLAFEKQENLKLVGSDTLELESEIQELHTLGEVISEKLAKIDERLKLVRSVEQD